jgi:hypothetical protein
MLFPLQTMKSGVQFYQGGLVGRDPADSALLKTAMSGYPMLEVIGISNNNQLGDGVLKANLEYGPHPLDNALSTDAVPVGFPLGWPLYAKDNHTASITNGGGLYPPCGWFGGFTGESTPRVIVWIGFCPFALHELLIPVAKGHADLTDADTSQDFTLYTLPGPARVICPPCIDSLTDFSGGGTGTGTFAIGADSDPDAIGDEHDIFTGADPGAMTAGVLGYAGALLVAGTVIKAQFATDTTLAAYTAGAIVAHLRLRPGN